MLSFFIWFSFEFLGMEDVFAFALSVVRMVGIALITTYVAIGMVIGPITHIRGFPDPRVELGRVRNRRIRIGIEISSIHSNRVVNNSNVFKWRSMVDSILILTARLNLKS